jgi:hypothetical protein
MNDGDVDPRVIRAEAEAIIADAETRIAAVDQRMQEIQAYNRRMTLVTSAGLVLALAALVLPPPLGFGICVGAITMWLAAFLLRRPKR